MVESDWKTDFPSAVWVVTMRRGAGREDILILVLFLRNEIIDRMAVGLDWIVCGDFGKFGIVLLFLLMKKLMLMKKFK